MSKAPSHLIVVVTGSMFFLAGFNVILSLLLQEGLNSAIYDKKVGRVSIIAFGLIVSCIIYLFLSYIFPVYKEKLYQYIAKNLKRAVLEGILEKSLKESETTTKGEYLTSVLEDCDNCSGYLVRTLLPSIQLFINILFGLAFVLCTNWKIGLMVFSTLPVFYFMNNMLAKKYEIAYEEYLNREGEQKTFFDEIHRNIILVLTFFAQNIVRHKNYEKFIKKFDAAKRKAKSAGNMITFTEVGVLLAELAIIAIGIISCQNRWMKIGTMIAIWNVTIGSVIYPMSELPYVLTDLAGQFVSVERIEKALKKSSFKEYNSAEKNKLINPVLVAKEVQYKIGESFKICVKNFECQQGEVVYIVGPSGGGKTTFAKILLSLYQHDEGEIFIVDKSGIIKSIQGYIAYVPQDKMIFNLSLKDNLLMGNIDIDVKKIRDAACKSNIDKTIQVLPKGYETIIGKDLKLSVGQEQRIAIARALSSEAKFIVFDEPFASLDIENIQIVSNMIKKTAEDHGCIVITHNTSMISEGDKVYQIVGGILNEKRWGISENV